MKSSAHSDPLNNLSHHAYLLVGDVTLRDELTSLLEKEHGLSVQGNPDFYTRNYEIFTIDDSREVKVLHSSRPVGGGQRGGNKMLQELKVSKKVDTSGVSNISNSSSKITQDKKIFILTMNGITVEAQNSLLKLFEEPAEYARFFIIIPSAHLLISTMQSRMREIQIPITKIQLPNEYIEDAQAFLKVSQSKRLDMVKKLVDDISKEKKTKQDAINFLNAIQQSVYSEKGPREGKIQLEAIELARNYLNDRAPSAKILLEYVALSI